MQQQFKEFKTLDDFKKEIEEYEYTLWDDISIIFLRIKHFWYDFIDGIKNLFKYSKLVWRDRWWDYYFLEDWILFKLKDMEKHWGEKTHYVGDCFTKKRLQVLIKKLEELKKLDEEFDKDIMKKRAEVYKLLGRNIGKFWD